jgi:tetratricopeptide (TPR) repeat protein
MVAGPMAKPAVEKYEQMLAQDPTSTVFVELAKALIEKGDHAKAIDVCKGGLEHHRESVVGRVLWGKALISLGKPAEAMEQFDKATTIDRDNPHAYNLIGEVLLHKGLYRSALPLLKKAVALQPNDGRVRQWLEQTQRALAGGPAPVLTEFTTVDPVDSSTIMTDPGLGVRQVAPVEARPAEPTGDPTEVNLRAYVPQSESAPAAPSAAPTALVPWTNPKVSVAEVAPRLAAQVVAAQVVAAPVEVAAPAAVQDPFDAVVARSPAVDTVRGLTDTFDALASDSPPAPAPSAPRLTESPSTESPLVSGLSGTFDALDDGPHVTEPTVIPSQELYVDAGAKKKAAPGGLLDDVPSEPLMVPEREFAAARAARPQAPPAADGPSLLGDIPDAFEPTSSVEVPKVELSPHAAEAIAKEYERELRDKLAAAAAKKTFLQRHGLKLGVSVVVGVALVAGLGVFFYTRHKNRGKDLQTALGDAKRALSLDTKASYRAALEALKLAAEMDEGSKEAWAMTAYADALLFAEHGGANEDKLAAQSALARPGVREAAPGLSLLDDLYLADGKAKEGARAALMASTLDETEVQAEVGRALIAEKKVDEGIKKLSRAIELRSANVRALVAMGDHLRDARDFENAIKFYSAAAQQSKEHPAAVLGLAEARLEVGREQAEALKELEALPAGAAFDGALLGRRELVRGRLLNAVGQGDEAVKALGEGAKLYPALTYEFAMALGEASRGAGQMEPAQRAFEAALKARPKEEDAKEALARVLIARDREREVLARILPEGEARRVYLVRGLAAARLNDWKKARSEIARTAVNGKYSIESAVVLSLADAAEGQADKAQEVLEKTLAASKKPRPEVRLALGQVYWQRGVLDKAKAQFEEAAKEPQDFEGSCSLGRLLVALGLPDMAIEPLAKAVARNGSHGEGRHALGRAYLAQGKVAEGQAQAEAWALDNPASAAAQRDLAFALLQAGKLKEADAASGRAVKLDGADAEAQRVRAMVLFGRGDSKQAFAALERANKLDPKDATTFCEVGMAFVRAGNLANGQKAYEAALREDPKSTCGAIGAHLTRLPGITKLAVRELSELGKSAHTNWDRAFAEATRARVLLVTGAAKEARKAADQAVALAPFSGGAHLALGLCAQRAKDDAKAREAFTRAAELEPVYGAVRLALADSLARGGPDELQKAIEEYEAFLRIGGSDGDLARVKKGLPVLKKRLAQR